GRHALGTALRIGRLGGYVNSHTWIPRVMARLCVRALDAGLEVDYVRELIRRRALVADPPSTMSESWPWPIKIYTLGRFTVLKAGRPLSCPPKAPRRPLALLLAIIALGSQGVHEDRLIDALWPDAEGAAARFALTSAVHRLRRILGRDDA